MQTDASTPPLTPMSARNPAVERWLVPNTWVLMGLWLFAALHFFNIWPTLGVVFRDTDDLTRLAEVRDFLAGQGWYDLHQYRLDPPSDIPMHWSRLVDLPIALLIRFFGLVFDPVTATKAAMFIWPAIPLLPALWASRAMAVRLGGGWAAFPAVYLLATHGLVVAQFVPGRIDHHNVQIALTMLMLACLLGPTGVRRGVLAGIIGAAMMTIGMETLPFLILAVSGLALRWVVEGDETGEAQAFGVSLALATLVAAGATLPPSEWSRGACDALSINYVGLAVAGGLGLAAVARFARVGLGGRAVALGVIAVGAVVAFAVPDPACLKGPFGQLLPEVRTVWLDGVNEVEPWTDLYGQEHLGALMALFTPLLGLLAFGFLGLDGARRRTVGFWVLGLSMVAATAIGLTQIRTLVYANALAVPMIAAAIGVFASQAEAKGRSITVTILAGAVAVNCMVVQLVLEPFVPASWLAEMQAANAATGVASPVASSVNGGASAPSASGAAPATALGPACFTMTNYAPLAAEPRGLVAAEIDMGPAILVATKHSVVGGPYHRMQRGILDSAHILNRPVAEAFAIMAARGVDYLAVCRVSKTEAKPGGILEKLRAGSIPAGLEEIAGNGSVRFFRVHVRPLLTSR